MSAALSSRVSSGGITKRSGGGRVRIDRDGDLDMDAPAGTRGRGNGRGGRGGRRGGGGPGRAVNLNNAPKGPAADRERVGGSGSGAIRGARGNTRRDPAGTRRPAGAGNSRRNAPAGPLVPVKVLGWKESKGTADECVKFLERKTNLKLKKV